MSVWWVVCLCLCLCLCLCVCVCVFVWKLGPCESSCHTTNGNKWQIERETNQRQLDKQRATKKSNMKTSTHRQRRKQIAERQRDKQKIQGNWEKITLVPQSRDRSLNWYTTKTVEQFYVHVNARRKEYWERIVENRSVTDSCSPYSFDWHECIRFHESSEWMEHLPVIVKQMLWMDRTKFFEWTISETCACERTHRLWDFIDKKCKCEAVSRLIFQFLSASFTLLQFFISLSLSFSQSLSLSLFLPVSLSLSFSQSLSLSLFLPVSLSLSHFLFFSIGFFFSPLPLRIRLLYYSVNMLCICIQLCFSLSFCHVFVFIGGCPPPNSPKTQKLHWGCDSRPPPRPRLSFQLWAAI